MEQHAIPQQISSYEFKLVGDMTLKQFLKAAIGVVLAVAINATHLIFFIKWPLVIIFGGGGLALAFVPFQDRPLEQWIMAFVKAIYSPTIYTYKKSTNSDWTMVSKDQEDKKKESEEKKEEEKKPVKDENKVKEFLNSLPEIKSPEIKYKEESKIVDEVISPTSMSTGMEAAKLENVENKEVAGEEDWRGQKTDLNLKTEKLGATAEVVFGEIPMPDKPEIPNMVVGMVTDSMGKIIEGAIVEIQDERGNPSRVLKTNPLGQFKTTAPMADGKYLVIPEKDNYKFDRVDINIAGKIVDPIKIKALV